MEKVRQHAKQVGNISKEMETLRKNKKERLDIKNTAVEMKNTFNGTIDWTRMRKESGSFKICQYKLPKLKCKEEKKLKNKTSKNCVTISEGQTYT